MPEPNRNRIHHRCTSPEFVPPIGDLRRNITAGVPNPRDSQRARVTFQKRLLLS